MKYRSFEPLITNRSFIHWKMGVITIKIYKRTTSIHTILNKVGHLKNEKVVQ